MAPVSPATPAPVPNIFQWKIIFEEGFEDGFGVLKDGGSKMIMARHLLIDDFAPTRADGIEDFVRCPRHDVRCLQELILCSANFSTELKKKHM
jgi:hypothetical protein